MWTETAQRARQEQNSRVQARLGLAIIVVVLIGVVALAVIAQRAGLYVPSRILRGWRGGVEFANAVFLLLWASTFHSLRVTDGSHYQLRLARSRASRSKTSDVLILIGYPVAATLWGALVVRGIFAARAADIASSIGMPHRSPVHSLEHGVNDVTIAYFTIVAAVFVVGVVAHWLNPVDLDAYDRYVGRILHLRRPFS